jgi:hypothetical protein
MDVVYQKLLRWRWKGNGSMIWTRSLRGAQRWQRAFCTTPLQAAKPAKKVPIKPHKAKLEYK